MACEHKAKAQSEGGCHSQCGSSKGSFDYLLWVSFGLVVFLYLHYGLLEETTHFAVWYETLSASVFEFINTMWWGVAIGIVMVAVLSKVPREFVVSILGSNRGLSGIARATAAGVLLDLCSHGILMVGAKLYERGASIGQVMAFLIASPWNSFSLTLVLVALIGLPWTLVFIALSMLVAVVVGLLFNYLVKRGTLPDNPVAVNLPDDFRFWAEAKKGLKNTHYSPAFFADMFISGIKGSRVVLRWMLFGVLLASVIRAFFPPELFGSYFGPSLLGLGATLIAATVIEICSEGSTPIAADLLVRAKAPGNSFAFLMTGVATDYTEIMVMKDTSKSWKIALFLPLLTVPQVVALAVLINYFSA